MSKVTVIGDKTPKTTLVDAMNKLEDEWYGAEIAVIAITFDELGEPHYDFTVSQSVNTPLLGWIAGCIEHDLKDQAVNPGFEMEIEGD